MRLRYWFTGALQLLGMVLGASALYCLVIWLQMDDEVQFSTALILHKTLFIQGGLK